MSKKSFFDVFLRYKPSDEKRNILNSATDASFRYSKDPMRVEVELSFDTHVDPMLIYEIEDECCALYNAASFKIIPHFPPDIFEMEYFHEVTAEASYIGAVTNGFFSGAKYEDDGSTITVAIPYRATGIRFVKDANTETIISNILKSRYGVIRKIEITESEDVTAREEEIERRIANRIKAAEDESKEEYARQMNEMRARAEAKAREEDPHYGFERRAGLSELTGNNQNLSDIQFIRGEKLYVTSSQKAIWGDTFVIEEPIPLSNIGEARGNAVFLGTVFLCEGKETRQGDKINITVGISDGSAGIYVKKTLPIEEKGLVKQIKTGMHVAVFGKLATDRFDNETYIAMRGISQISANEREDSADTKRVELHLHTNMSQMDGLITPADLVSTAIRWGHSAIAVTDHGNVQAFPEIMLEVDKARKDGKDLKVLYGMEAYFVNDSAKFIFGDGYPALDDEFVVFDIETTGTSFRNCKIIEIGAVKIKGGEVIDSFDIFVDPEEHIPEKITELTSITDEMVAGADKEPEAITKFLEYIGDRMLIAHNANFDVSFIKVAAERLGIRLKNTYLDTLGLSRYLNPKLSNHKLDTLVKHYEIGEFHHHRASDDALVTARIFIKMLDGIKGEGVSSFEEMVSAMAEKSDPLALPSYHMIIIAKDQVGLKNLYKLVSFSYLNYFGGAGRQKKVPRIPKSVLDAHRDGLIIGSACESGELFKALVDGREETDIEEIAEYYDYLEIQPICNNRFLIAEGKASDDEALREFNRRIYALGKKLGKPVVATCDAHFLNKSDELYRRILLAGMKFKDADKPLPIYLRTTEEMLAEFDYLGADAAYEVVVENTRLIADMCGDVRPIPKGRYEPNIEGAADELTESCWRRAHEWYGENLPEIVEKRLKRELDSIIGNGFAVLYMIAVKLVAYSESLGYLVGSRGSVGSSFVATMSGISEVNPLAPHYRCPKCKYSEFFTDGSVGSGFDLDDKSCPVCGEPLIMDGHDIPFETFLGFFGDKSPDIDLNFSGDVQGKVHKYTEELFGEGHVFRAGTIGTLADKTAWGYINKYLEEKQIAISRAQVDYMVTQMVGIKRTTSQHPGGIIVVPTEYEIYDFSPIQHPADDPNSDIITTHYQFSYLHDTILKLDELGHDMPTKYKMLEKYTNTSVLDVKMNDKSVYELFHSTKPLGITPDDIGGCQLGTFGIPEMGTRFIQQVLIDAQPKTFADLLQISGLTHGTDVWLGNGQDLIKQGICTISEVIGTRDGIMLYLIRHNIENATSFNIMESVRKGKGLTPEWEKIMREHDVPDWYIASCKKIKYMFPKAHAAAYVMSAIRLCWYKIYYPMEFYAAFFTVAPGGFNAEIVMKGYSAVSEAIEEIEAKGQEATAKDNEMLATMQLVREALARGVQFLPVDLWKSDAKAFLPEDGKIRMPFNSLPGVGDTAGEKLAYARDNYNILSMQELREFSGVSKSVIELLASCGALGNLSRTNQISFF